MIAADVVELCALLGVVPLIALACVALASELRKL